MTPEELYREDHLHTDLVRFGVVLVSAAIDETPEGMFVMDRLESDARLGREASGVPESVFASIDAKMEKAIFFGE